MTPGWGGLDHCLLSLFDIVNNLFVSVLYFAFIVIR